MQAREHILFLRLMNGESNRGQPNQAAKRSIRQSLQRFRHSALVPTHDLQEADHLSALLVSQDYHTAA